MTFKQMHKEIQAYIWEDTQPEDITMWLKMAQENLFSYCVFPGCRFKAKNRHGLTIHMSKVHVTPLVKLATDRYLKNTKKRV